MTDIQAVPESGAAGTAPPVAGTTRVTDSQMIAELRSWGRWMVVFAIFNLLMADFSAGFGAVLLIIALCTFTLQAPAMFVVLGVTMAAAALSNLAALAAFGEFAAVIWIPVQLWLAVKLFRLFSQHHQAGPPEAAAVGRLRAARWMPWFSAGAGLMGLMGFGGLFLYGIYWYGFVSEADLPPVYDFGISLSLELGFLGIGFGLGSLLSGYRHRLLPAAGMAAGGLMLLVTIVSILWTL